MNNFGFFNVLSHILYDRPLKEENINDFSLFMFNRCLSMRSPEDCEFVNSFINSKELAAITDKKELVDALKNIIIKQKYSKITYIKKQKKEKNKTLKNELEKIIPIMSENLEISEKDCRVLLEDERVVNTKEFKQLKKGLKYV
jgi:hypothetical protein